METTDRKNKASHGHLYFQKPGGRLNIKMTSYQHRDPHVNGKMVLWLSYL